MILQINNGKKKIQVIIQKGSELLTFISSVNKHLSCLIYRRVPTKVGTCNNVGTRNLHIQHSQSVKASQTKVEIKVKQVVILLLPNTLQPVWMSLVLGALGSGEQQRRHHIPVYFSRRLFRSTSYTNGVMVRVILITWSNKNGCFQNFHLSSCWWFYK